MRKNYPYTPLRLKPDFVICDQNEKPLIILDAKFSFDIEEDDENEEMEGIDKEAPPIFKPKFSNIIKMHAYKDSLKALTAIVL
ncbi:MAG: nuclease domain-containing protein [Candidatus Hydrothermales bacterium]